MRRRLAVLLVFLALAVACAPTYKRLPSLESVPELASLAQRGADRLHRSWSLPVGEVDGVPYSIVASETGSDRSDELVVLIHGFVSDRTTWQFVSGLLGERHRLWIPDQLGCGDSARPDPALAGEETYGATGQARNLLEALRQRNDEAGWPDRIVFVGHSLGGAITLRILGSMELREAYPRIFERVDRAVLIAPLGFAVHRADHTMRELGTVGGFRLFLGKAVGYVRENVAIELLAAAEKPNWVFRFDADRVLDAFRDKQARRATQAIIRQTIPFDARGRPDWSMIDRLVADYRNVDLPVLLLWGGRDETLSLAMGYKLLAELPDARLRILREGKHSLQADRPAEVTEWIERFVEDAGAGWDRLEYVD